MSFPSLYLIFAQLPLDKLTPPPGSASWSDWISQLAHSPSVMKKSVTFLIVAGVVFLVKILFTWRFSHLIKDDDKRYYANKIVTAFSYIIVLVALLVIVYQELSGLGTVIGLVGAGVAVALSDLIVSFAGWFVIIGDRGFKTGDRIRVGDVKGDVVDIGLLRTTLMEVDSKSLAGQATGTIIFMPNSRVFKEPVVNYTVGNEFVWYEISFLFTYESDFDAAERILYEAVYTLDMEQYIEKASAKIKAMTHQFRVKFGKLTPLVYAWPDDSGMRMTLRFLSPVRIARINEDHVAREVIAGVQKNPQVQFAYPTMRVIAGKPSESISPLLKPRET